MLRVAVVVGNPKPRSRTWEAAQRLAAGLGATDVHDWDLVNLGVALLKPGDAAVQQVCSQVAASDVVVMASPTFKATYSGLLKLFLDQVGADGLRGVVAVPLMLGAGLTHQLAPEVHLKPVLADLGALTPTAALYLVDSAPQPDPVEAAWLDRWGPAVRRSVT